MRISAALNAISQMRKDVYESTLMEKLSIIFKTVEDKDLDLTFYCLMNLPECWEYLDVDVRDKISSYTESLPRDKMDDIGFILRLPELAVFAKRRIRRATREDLTSAFFFELPMPVADKVVELYVDSGSYEQANSFSSVVKLHAIDYSKEQIERIIKACGENSQIKESNQVGNVIAALRKNANISDTEMDNWLSEVGMSSYSQSEPAE